MRAFGQEYRRRHAVSPDQARVLRDIEVCRTAELGGYIDVCEHCGYHAPRYHSCRSRHCPKCQSLQQARWIEARSQRMLPCRHFHVVFTLPAALRPIALRNRKVIFSLLFRTAARTLLAFGHNDRWLGAQLGITAVLHTWTRHLRFHPHLHCIVTAGGLDVAARTWCTPRHAGKFLFPVKALGKVFRGKMIDAIARTRRAGSLDLAGSCAELAQPDGFARFRDRLFQKPWVVYAKRPFGGVEHVIRYLGRYTHRIAISNQRLRSLTDRDVTFLTKDGNTETIPPLEFLRRFLLHVLPKGFVKIRHYGLLASGNVRTRLALARDLLLGDSAATPLQPAPTDEDQPTTAPDWRDLLLRLTGIDPSRCPNCGRRLSREPLPSPSPATRTRAPPLCLAA